MLSREASAATLPDGLAPSQEQQPTADIIGADAAAAARYGQLRVVPFLSETQRDLLRRSLCKNLDDDQAKYFFEVAERTKLDPFTAQIRPDIRQTKDSDGVKHPTLIVITTLQGFRTLGDRSGQLDGEDPVEWCDAEGNWSQQWLSDKPPVAARGTVYRKDRSRPQVTVCRWDAYVVKVYDRSGKEIPNKFWQKMGAHMLGKCSLVGSYRAAFPNPCSGLYIQEELAEELDPESEAAIEAEVTRRANADKEYWDKERAKGNLPVNDLPPEKNGKKKKEKAAAPPPPPPQPEAPQTPQEPSIPPPAPTGPSPAPEPIREVLSEPDPAWKDFPLTRIKLFAGRTVGSLTRGELRGVRGNWMSRVESSWPSVDADIKAHYAALMRRIEYEDAIEKAAEEATSSLSEDAKRAALDDQLNDMQLPFSP